MTVPSSTYRLQLRGDQDFDAVVAILDDLVELGVSHVYLSPVLQAAPGSTHGYDVVDPTRVDEVLGGEPGRERLVAALRDAGLGVVLDTVPNHLALVTPANRWWWDVLARGPASPHAPVFDVDWGPPADQPRRVLVPVLGAPLEEELAGSALRFDVLDGEIVLAYHEHRFPLREGSLTALTGSPPQPDRVDELSADRDLLRRLLARQHYEPAHWRRANTDLNYRRFFDITSLGGVRVEDPEVFAATHGRILEWVRRGEVDGLRIDHPDGLRDPTGYCARLREAAPDAWIVVEKVLEAGEQLRDWPVDGTTGYEFCNLVHRLQLDPDGDAPLTRLYAELTGESVDWDATVRAAKDQVLGELFGAELRRLTDRFETVVRHHGRILARHRLRDAIAQVAVAFPVYRTYVQPDRGAIDEADTARIDEALATARHHRPDLADVLDLLGAVLTLQLDGPDETELVAGFQQLTGPVMAKGVEDTAFYRYLRLASLNEVGGDPGRFAVSVAAFHAANAHRQRTHPEAMLTTSTHDTKRAEDVRARLAVLSEVPDRWAQVVRGWYERSRPRREGPGTPSRNAEYLLYQTLVGAWPIGADRVLPYLEKAAREIKRRSHWLDVDPDYEAALRDLAEAALHDRALVDELEAFVGEIRDAGWVNSLAQTLLRLTCPGVPDTYQGTERWDLSLVDPDNRRPVDAAGRRQALGELRAGLSAPQLWARRAEGLPKLAVVQRALRLRRERPASFGRDGGYRPLDAQGPRADHVVAYQRGDDVIAVVPRLTTHLGSAFGDWAWQDTQLELPGGTWRDRLSEQVIEGGAVPVAELLTEFPVALLVRQEPT